MNRLPIVIGFVALATAGCASAPQTPAADTTSSPPSQRTVTTTTAVVAPAEPTPARDGTCPYLSSDFVAQANGQHVSKVRLSADEPHPACFFYRGDGSLQLQVQVFHGAAPGVARAVVDRAAPVATSDPATLPGGWEGGKQPTDTGAVFAVAKAGAAVVVITNQKQTIKASRIAEQTIAALGL